MSWMHAASWRFYETSFFFCSPFRAALITILMSSLALIWNYYDLSHYQPFNSPPNEKFDTMKWNTHHSTSKTLLSTTTTIVHNFPSIHPNKQPNELKAFNESALTKTLLQTIFIVFFFLVSLSITINSCTFFHKYLFQFARADISDFFFNMHGTFS